MYITCLLAVSSFVYSILMEVKEKAGNANHSVTGSIICSCKACINLNSTEKIVLINICVV